MDIVTPADEVKDFLYNSSDNVVGLSNAETDMTSLVHNPPNECMKVHATGSGCGQGSLS